MHTYTQKRTPYHPKALIGCNIRQCLLVRRAWNRSALHRTVKSRPLKIKKRKSRVLMGMRNTPKISPVTPWIISCPSWKSLKVRECVFSLMFRERVPKRYSIIRKASRLNSSKWHLGRGIGTETCMLDNVLPSDDLRFDSDTEHDLCWCVLSPFLFF